MSDIYTWEEVVQSGALDGYRRTLKPVHEMFTKGLVCENECDSELFIHAYVKETNPIENCKTYFECSVCGNTKEF